MKTHFLFLRTATALVLLLLGATALHAAPAKPNILWITSEDHGPHMGCYGDTFATTPNVDALAAKGLRYNRAWSCAPVCAPARTTIISGMFPPSTGAENMRSLVGLPQGKQMYPQLLRNAGYYCSNNSKEDYNLDNPEKPWNDSSKKGHWRNRAAGQPFMAVFNSEKSHESKIRVRPHTPIHDPSKVRVPAYHPDTPEVRQDWAQYYDVVSEADEDAGKLLKQLQDDGLMEDTIIFYYGDHGSGMPRSKRWPYNSGLHVPLVVYIPEKFKDLRPPEYKPGGASDRLVSFVDFAPTLLSLAGVQPPEWMQGYAFLGKYQTEPKPYIYGFRGRMDERYDLVRSVTDGRYVYIRNYMPHRIYGQKLDYMWQMPTTQVWEKLHLAGKLTPAQDAFWNVKPSEELYDLQTDRDEINNLAYQPAHQATLEKLRKAQRDHALRIRDIGFLTEAEMHARANGTSLYELGHDAKRYPLERVIDMAEAASSRDPKLVSKLKDGLTDTDSAVRYWAIVGFLNRGEGAVKGAIDGLRNTLKDSSPSVRIAAAETLGRFGAATDLAPALEVIKELATADKNGAYVSMLALNSLDALGRKGDSLKEFLTKMETSDPKAAKRANGYVARLVEDIVPGAKGK
ncbi:MAG TPA: sulfatase-like hydrolase/transferase [Roseimicrobium sp.]|nr:sulfatase-like hydrolase/transferase [Roseimicrobium sp.]